MPSVPGSGMAAMPWQARSTSLPGLANGALFAFTVAGLRSRTMNAAD